MQTISAKSPDKALKMVKETIESFLLIAAYLEIRTVEQQLLNVCTNFIEQNFPSEDRHNEILKTTNLRNSFLDPQNH